MIKEFRLPDVGEGLTEADIVTWHVKPGDQVTVNQVIVEIETAKALVELPSPFDGTVSRLLVNEGQTVDVGAPIIAIDVTGADGQATEAVRSDEERAVADRAAAAAEASDTSGAQSVLVGYGVRESSTTRRRRVGVPSAAAPPAPAAPAAPSNGTSMSHRQPSMAVDESSTANRTGTRRSRSRRCGSWLRIWGWISLGFPGLGRRDLSPGMMCSGRLRHRWPRPLRRGRRVPVRGVRKHTAAAMVASAFTAPHVTEFLQVDVTDTMAAARRIRELPEFADVKVSPLLFVARALLAAAARHPMINSSWDEAAQEIVVQGQVNLGIAVATERGLIVP